MGGYIRRKYFYMLFSFFKLFSVVGKGLTIYMYYTMMYTCIIDGPTSSISLVPQVYLHIRTQTNQKVLKVHFLIGVSTGAQV